MLEPNNYAVKIVILKSDFPSEHHAVLAVHVDGQWLILDNRTLTLVRDIDLTRLVPELILDQTGVRRFVSKGRNHRIAGIADENAISVSFFKHGPMPPKSVSIKVEAGQSCVG